MNNFNITLDTTPPVLTINAIEYDNKIDVRVGTNEPIDTGYYQAKVFDNNFNVFDVPLTWDELDMQMVGTIDTANLVDGVLKIEVTLYDEVHNSYTEKVSYLFRNDYDIEITYMTMDNTIEYRL